MVCVTDARGGAIWDAAAAIALYAMQGGGV